MYLQLVRQEITAEGVPWVFFCGATLITLEYAISAHHCFEALGGKPAENLEDYRVVAGRYHRYPNPKLLQKKTNLGCFFFSINCDLMSF